MHELEQFKVDIPNQLETMETAQSEAETRLADQETKVADIEKDRRQHERDLEAAQEQVKKYQGQLYSVKTNKEYDALQAEIQAQKNRISELEDAILLLITEAETEQETLETIRGETESLIERFGEERTALESRLSAVDEDVAVKMDERKRMAMRVENQVLKVYDRIRRNLRGMTVVPLKKGACSGCFHVIPLQVIMQIRQGRRLISCESCGRILILEEGLEY
ncbi:MAG: C4-type zinc ribbon domain-containing protein [Gemmatimonadetes bacterium]|nr:C4-type zinc ribbon domain-containing protein [Gemmatimonadota bacterium]